MKLIKRIRDGGSLMQIVTVKRTSEMQPELLVGNAGGDTSLTIESGHVLWQLEWYHGIF